MSTNTPSNAENKSPFSSSRNINSVFLSSFANNFQSQARPANPMAPVQSSRHIESAFKRESEQRKERLSYTGRNPRKRSQTPRGKGEQIYDFGKSPAKGGRIRRTFQGTSTL